MKWTTKATPGATSAGNAAPRDAAPTRAPLQEPRRAHRRSGNRQQIREPLETARERVGLGDQAQHQMGLAFEIVEVSRMRGQVARTQIIAKSRTITFANK